MLFLGLKEQISHSCQFNIRKSCKKIGYIHVCIILTDREICDGNQRMLAHNEHGERLCWDVSYRTSRTHWAAFAEIVHKIMRDRERERER